MAQKAIENGCFEELPETLFRYREVGSEFFEEEIKQLAHGKIWLSPLERANDPFEGHPVYDVSDFAEFEAEYNRLFVEHEGQLSKNSWLRGPKDENVTLQEFFGALVKRHILFFENLPNDVNTACFSIGRSDGQPDNTHLLQWAHYAQEFAGLCLVFNKCNSCTIKTTRVRTAKIIYKKERHHVTTVEMLRLDFLRHVGGIKTIWTPRCIG